MFFLRPFLESCVILRIVRFSSKNKKNFSLVVCVFFLLDGEMCMPFMSGLMNSVGVQ